MESTARNPIDFQKLELQLEAAMLADQKYERENAAKFRAINQKVGSYEEFRYVLTFPGISVNEFMFISSVRP